MIILLIMIKGIVLSHDFVIGLEDVQCDNHHCI